MKARAAICLCLGFICAIMLFTCSSPNSAKIQTQTPHSSFSLPNYAGQAVYRTANIAELRATIPATAKLDSSALAIKLRGDTNNPFGIRRDILEYILSAIPESNPRAINAAIRYAQYDQYIYYNSDPVQAREYAEWLGNAGICLDAFIGDRQSGKIISTISDLYRNTPARKEWIWQVESEVLGWHVFAGSTGNLADKNWQEQKAFCLDDGTYWR